MIKEEAMRLLSLDTSDLVELYSVGNKTPCQAKLPRDYMVTSILNRQFGEEAVRTQLLSSGTRPPSWI